jgi:hypothetical protein
MDPFTKKPKDPKELKKGPRKKKRSPEKPKDPNKLRKGPTKRKRPQEDSDPDNKRRPYRLGNHDYFGSGSSFTVDSTQKFSVVTQFLTDDGTDSGTLSEIKRFYVQNGNVIENAYTKLSGLDSYNSIT